MYCQKCKTPLRLDGSLENLSNSALQHLAGPPLPIRQRHVASDSAQTPQVAAQRKVYDEASRNAPSSPTFKRSNPRQQSDPAAMSFVMLSESQIGGPPSPPRQRPSASRQSTPSKKSKEKPGLNGRRTSATSSNSQFSQRALTSAQMFEILSSRSDIDHPICAECSDTLVQRMEARLSSAAKERDAFAEFLRNLQADMPTDEEAAQTRKDLDRAREEERDAMRNLENLEKEKASLEEEFAKLEEESQALELEEAQFWHEHNEFHAKMRTYESQKESAELRLQHDQRLLERLQRANVYNDTFAISYDGSYGTINGLRLGRLSSPSVEWAEVNAAWGQALLLLVVVAEKLEYSFQGYNLISLGSYSKIEKFETSTRSSMASDGSGRGGSSRGKDKGATIKSGSDSGTTTSLPLYHTPDLNPLNVTFFHRPFDNGMIAYLECLRQLGLHLEALTAPAQPNKAKAEDSQPRLKMPYEIKKDKINDLSIKLGSFGGDEGWTKACKHTLTYLKYLLAGASNIAGAGGGTRR